MYVCECDDEDGHGQQEDKFELNESAKMTKQKKYRVDPTFERNNNRA